MIRQMEILVDVLIFVFGMIVGSFLNVLIYRYNTGRTIVAGRSMCLSCGRELRWFELIPVFSFLFQRGRCRKCATRISWQYPVVEIATGVLFAAVWQLGLAWFHTALLWAIFSLLVAVTVYDLRHKIIPDALVYIFIVLSLVTAYFSSLTEHVLTGIGLAAFFALLWLVSSGRWMGFGDAKLALGVGFLLGARGGVSATIFAFWSGAIIGVLLILIQRLSRRPGSFTIKSEIPFAPFIVAGVLANLFFHFDLFSIYL